MVPARAEHHIPLSLPGMAAYRAPALLQPIELAKPSLMLTLKKSHLLLDNVAGLSSVAGSRVVSQFGFDFIWIG